MRLAITLQNQSYLADCAYRLVGVSDLTSSVMAGRIFVWKQWGTKIKGRSWIWQLSLPHNFTMLLRICLYLRFRYLFYMTCPLNWLTLIIFQISHVCHVGPRAWCSQGCYLGWEAKADCSSGREKSLPRQFCVAGNVAPSYSLPVGNNACDQSPKSWIICLLESKEWNALVNLAVFRCQW